MNKLSVFDCLPYHLFIYFFLEVGNKDVISVSFVGIRPFACPHCDKKFRTSGHRKTHIASHFKHTELRKMRHQRKPAKIRIGKSNVPVPDIPLQEPILITDLGKVFNIILLERNFIFYIEESRNERNVST